MKERLGNEDQMAEVRAAMEAAKKQQQVAAGDNHTNSVPIEYTSLESGKTYEGHVVFKRLSAGDMMRVGGIKSNLLRAAGVQDINLVTNDIMFLVQVIAELEVAVVKRPEWLMNINAVEDTDVLLHVHGKYGEWVNSFRRGVPAAAGGDSAPTDGAEKLDSQEVRL